MNKRLAARIMDLLQRRQLKGTLAKIALMLSCVAIFMITYMLVAPVLTQEWDPICGKEEHVHTDECYTLVSADQLGHRHTGECYEDFLGIAACGMEEHVHGDDCLDEDGNLICELPEHTHTLDCCEAVGEIICGQKGHTHSEDCLDEDGNLTCELPEHIHTAECCEFTGKVVCELSEHTHGEDCLDEDGNLICELPEHIHTAECCAFDEEDADSDTDTGSDADTGSDSDTAAGTDTSTNTGADTGAAGHRHSEECYSLVPVEGTGHTHGEECYTVKEGHTHSEECYTQERGELTCGLAEHTHGDGCLDEEGNLACGKEEHTHADGCYAANEVLTCGLEETEGEKVLTCGLEESEPEMEKVLTCGLEETDAVGEFEQSGEPEQSDAAGEPEQNDPTGKPEQSDEPEQSDTAGEPEQSDEPEQSGGPEQDDPAGEPEETEEPDEESVYVLLTLLTCDEEEAEYAESDVQLLGQTEGLKPGMMKVLTCGLEEHEHVDACYQKEGEAEPEYTCGILTEHTHGEGCYFEDGTLKCNIPEHTHDESCLAKPEKTKQSWGGFPEELPEGYVEAEIYQPEAAVFAVMNGLDGDAADSEAVAADGEDAASTDETFGAELGAQVYFPENAFEEQVVFVPQLLFEEDEAYTAAGNVLVEAGVEYDSLTAMDLSFIGVDSYETLEPKTESGPVYVRLTMPAVWLGETEETEVNYTLWHHTESGAEEVETSGITCEDGTLTVEFMTESFSIYTVTAAAEPPGGGSSPVSWGTTVPTVAPGVENGVTTWDVFDVNYRYVDIPVSINVSNLEQDMTVTLPLILDIANAGRDGYKPAYKETGAAGDGWTIKTDAEKVTVTIRSFGTGHKSIDVYYRFDCWQVVSDKQFTVRYTVANGSGEGQGASSEGMLTGCVRTGTGGTIIKYATDWDESIYSFNGFGGADKQGAYILAWSDVYQTYFGLGQSEFDNVNYIYDIAAYEVEPKGQQPYSISGVITPDQNGEVIGGVYMMDSAGDQEAEGALCLRSIDSESGFQIEGNKFTIAENSLTKVVSSLEDETDHKTYTLYFLVKYPRSSLTGYEDIKDWKGDVIDRKVKLSATLDLTHTGIDSNQTTPITGETNFCCYDGASKVDARIYWATYYSTVVNSSAGLTMLNSGNTATTEYSADFFCLNEARQDFKTSPSRTLVAIIDLAYLTNNGKQQLDTEDYRISGFNLSLIDAPGSWSQNTTNTPNVGWTVDKYAAPTGGLENIRVYGSTSLTGDSWTEVAQVPAASVWAQDQNRAFKKNFTSIDGSYVRLKVEYDSHYTTALRVGYQMELKPSILSKYNLLKAETLSLTNWINYGAYKSVSGGRKADLDNFVFQRYPVDDSTPAWANYDGTIHEVREYDNASGPTSGLPGYNLNKESWDVGYSLRGFARTTLGSSTDVAGMMVTQALYDSDGNLVGNPTSIDPNTNDSYSQKTEVANVSEIVYNISGAVTSGATSLGDLQERINAAGEDSPYKSLKMRYYVLLPAGLTLNTNPDNGETDENGAPKYHFWTAGTTEYLSANSAFYNNNSGKVVQGGQTDVPVSDANIPGWKRLSANGNLSEMYWVAGGAVTHDTEASGGQLVVFERTLGNWADYDRFNMWGTSETFFWGRGLSFSVVPEKGTGSLPAGTYTPQFWCQFLDGNGSPISLDKFAKVDDVKEDQVGQPAGTLLYIPSTFINKHHLGSSDGEIEVVIDKDSSVDLENGTTAVKPEGSYSYPLTYMVESGQSTDVVLWCNVEDIQHYKVESEWHGTVTGVELNQTGAKVYVRTETFDANVYVTNRAGKNDLTVENGWISVDPITYHDWSKVKAIAFSFEGTTFVAGQEATVNINMKAPKDNGLYIGPEEDGIQKEVGKTEYKAYNELLISDRHAEDVENSGTGDKNACYFANFVEVPMKVTPVSYVLPSTGGAGTTTLYTTGAAFLTAAAYLMYQALRRRRVTGAPVAQPQDGRGGSRLR